MSFLYAAQPPISQAKNTTIPLVPGATFNIYLNVNNTQDTKSNNSTNVTTAQIAKPAAPDSPLLKKLAELKPDLSIPQSVKDQLHNGTNLFAAYKWHLLGATLIGSYALLCWIIVKGNSYLGKNELWSSWRQELALDQLLAIPQEQFAQELLREIQRRYTNPASLTDLVKPLTEFVTTIEEEEAAIKWYQSFYSWISYLNVHKIIPFSKNRFGKITERLQRIAYFKNAFQTWAAQYQLEHAARNTLHIIHNDEKDVSEMVEEMRIATIIAMHRSWAKITQDNEHD